MIAFRRHSDGAYDVRLSVGRYRATVAVEATWQGSGWYVTGPGGVEYLGDLPLWPYRLLAFGLRPPPYAYTARPCACCDDEKP